MALEYLMAGARDDQAPRQPSRAAMHPSDKEQSLEFRKRTSIAFSAA
jgi:hypothetical protein